ELAVEDEVPALQGHVSAHVVDAQPDLIDPPPRGVSDRHMLDQLEPEPGGKAEHLCVDFQSVVIKRLARAEEALSPRPVKHRRSPRRVDEAAAADDLKSPSTAHIVGPDIASGCGRSEDAAEETCGRKTRHPSPWNEPASASCTSCACLPALGFAAGAHAEAARGAQFLRTSRRPCVGCAASDPGQGDELKSTRTP